MAKVDPGWKRKVVGKETFDFIDCRYVEEALDIGPGHRRFNVTVVLDEDRVATVPVVLSPERIEEAYGIAPLDR